MFARLPDFGDAFALRITLRDIEPAIWRTVIVPAEKEWVGRRFDPARFDIAAVNKRLATLSKRLARARK